MKWGLGALGLGLGAMACGGAVAGSNDGADGGIDSGVAVASPKRSVRADKLGETCSVENVCGKPQICANFDAVDTYARGSLCSPPDPCSLVKCLDGETCVARGAAPYFVECTN